LNGKGCVEKNFWLGTKWDKWVNELSLFAYQIVRTLFVNAKDI